MSLTKHPAGGYAFLPGIAPYSCGVVAQPGFEIVHVILQRPVPWREGFDRIAAQLEASGRPRTALCSVSLRSPLPFTFAGFAEFNRTYAAVLQEWGVFVDGVNPIARTNIAPIHAAPAAPALYGFGFTMPLSAPQRDQPAATAAAAPQWPTFVVAGAGELPEGVLQADAIVARGDCSPAGVTAKARFVMNLMQQRLTGLGVGWADVTQANIYTVHPVTPFLPELLQQLGPASIHGATWHYSRPPIQEIEFEMDLRGTVHELRLPST